jgi:branched-chain amino acid aminotransferase
MNIDVVEKQITLEELKAADSAFYCGTAAEVIGIVSLEKVPFPKPWKETLGAKLQAAYKDLVLEKNSSPVLTLV